MGTIDLMVTLIILFYTLFPKSIIFYGAFYLIVKGLIFVLTSKDFASYIDVICGVYTVFLALGISHPIITIAVALFLGQKVVFSLL
tara:strand:- start:15717 stop:15974 length:258 start_codon:yes stop_codon:yes gene_type:complete